MSSPLQNNITNLQSVLDAVNALPEATAQATPSITVNASGLITATAGTKTGTKQLTTQAAKTVTPSTSSQTAVASGIYTTGDVTVAGDANLRAENIVEGVSIFGVTGSYGRNSGSSEGGMQVVSGTFAPNSSYTAGSNITITGLSFRPQYVFVSITTGTSLSSANLYLLCVFIDDVGDKTKVITSYKATATLKAYMIGININSIEAEATDDGFTICFADTVYTIGSSYMWYAFG